MADLAAQHDATVGPEGLASFLTADLAYEQWSDRHSVLVLDRPPYRFVPTRFLSEKIDGPEISPG
jgi:hypothetical protein